MHGVRVYRGRPSPAHQATSAAANDRQTASWDRSRLVTVIRRPLRYPSDWPASPAGEKGIDVALAIDIVAMGMDNGYDAAILVSSDTDLMPAIETVFARKLGHIELATWAGARRLRFPNTQLGDATSSPSRTTAPSKTTPTTLDPDPRQVRVVTRGITCDASLRRPGALQALPCKR